MGEINYVFRQPFLYPYEGEECERNDEEQVLSEKVSSLWARFAHEGEMDHEWPRFQAPAHEATLKLDLGFLEAFDVEMGYARGTCNVLDKLNVSFQEFSVFMAEFYDMPIQSFVV